MFQRFSKFARKNKVVKSGSLRFYLQFEALAANQSFKFPISKPKHYIYQKYQASIPDDQRAVQELSQRPLLLLTNYNKPTKNKILISSACRVDHEVGLVLKNPAASQIIKFSQISPPKYLKQIETKYISAEKKKPAKRTARKMAGRTKYIVQETSDW
jgi:hypothetical protein